MSEPERPPPGGYLDPRALRARRNERGELVVSLCSQSGSEATYEVVRPVRAFPFTAPEEQIVLIDGEDREIGMIRDLGELDAASREAILAELSVAYLVPRVTTIRSVRSRFGVTTWDLETDRGPHVAHVKERTDIRLLPDGRTMLTDVHGVQYEIPPRDELDERSRFWLDFEG
jgi:hypothetical protein